MDSTKTTYQRFFEQAVSSPVLEREEELKLFEEYRAGKIGARDKIVSSYLRMVLPLVREFRHYNIDDGDLIQEGVIGILKAVETYDPAKGVFYSYAIKFVKGAIAQFVVENWKIVSPGTGNIKRRLFFSIRSLKISLENQGITGIEALRQIAKIKEAPLYLVKQMENFLTTSDMDTTVSLEDSVDHHWVPDERPRPEDDAEHNEAVFIVSEKLDQLDERTKAIFEARLQEEPETYRSIAKRLGISAQRIEQLEKSAIKKIRSEICGTSENASAPRKQKTLANGENKTRKSVDSMVSVV